MAIFPKGLIHGFSQNMAIFHILLANISQKNVLYDIVEQKHAFLSDKNQQLKKKIRFFPRG